MAQYDDLLEDEPESGAFDADLEPEGFEPYEDKKESGVVIVEPPIIQIGRAKRKDELKKMQSLQDEPGREVSSD